MTLRLIDKPERKAVRSHISSIALDIGMAMAATYAFLPDDLKKELPTTWVAGAIFVTCMVGRIGKIIRQEPRPRAPRKPRSQP